ncbi:DUF397 domain-containing protein [Dactylosporangium sp. CA-152071]|uniref:DUF397 domain-containing protein n=1 Tax=Dactylosporangium sp. CA-152071 TaxID=3239933 RepID=UPI003D8C406B
MSKDALRAQLGNNTVWRKSTRSGPYSDNCVEVADLAGGRAVRDSKDAAGPVLVFDVDEWAAFREGVLAGEF